MTTMNKFDEQRAKEVAMKSSARTHGDRLDALEKAVANLQKANKAKATAKA